MSLSRSPPSTPPSPPRELSGIGLPLPAIHLGSFSTMQMPPRRTSPPMDPSAPLRVVPEMYFYPEDLAEPASRYPAPAQPPPPMQAAIEEVCVECMMRDRDMADVDVTSPGIWARESDVWYEELVRREEEEMRSGVAPEPTRRRTPAHGGMLTAANLRIWTQMVCCLFRFFFFGSLADWFAAPERTSGTLDYSNGLCAQTGCVARGGAASPCASCSRVEAARQPVARYIPCSASVCL